MVTGVLIACPRWRRKIPIEFFLLFGRQHRAHPVEGVGEKKVALMLHLLAHPDRLVPGIVHDLDNLPALGGRQNKVTIHAIDYSCTRHLQILVTIRESAGCKADQQTRKPNQQRNPEICLSWQGRYPWRRDPARTDR